MKSIETSTKTTATDKKSIKSILSQRTTPTFRNFFDFYIIFAIICLGINFILAIESRGLSWSKTLFGTGYNTDMFMDFFNSLRDASDPNVYTARNNIYPPLCLLLFKFLGFFIDKDILDTRQAERYIVQYDQRSMMIYIIFVTIVLLMSLRILNAYINATNLDETRKKEGKVLTFFMIMSYPTLYCIERGNILLVCFLCTAYFVFFYKSESKFLRETSLIALAIAAGLKLYPALFGVLLLLDSRWKDAAKAIIYGVLALVIPGLFFMLPSASTASILPDSLMIGQTALQSQNVVTKLIDNIMHFAFTKKASYSLSSVSIENFIYIFGKATGYSVSTEAKITCVIFEAIAAIALLFVKKEWQRIFLISYIILNIPSASSSYSLIFLILPFYSFLFKETEHTKIDWYYMITFTLLLVHLPNVFIFNMYPIKVIFEALRLTLNYKPNQWIATILFQAMMITVVITTIISYTKKNETTKQNKNKKKKNDEPITEAA